MKNFNKVNEAEEAGVSFSDVLGAINHLKYYLMGIILLSVAVSVALIGFRPGVDDPVTYFVELISVKNKAYPNGAAFSANDLLSADVLEAIRNKYGVSDYKKLRGAISVNYGSLAVEGISRKYADQLAQKNLSQADITAINNNYSQELSGVNEKGLRISVEPKHLGVSENVAKEIVIDIPRFWSEISIKKYKIFEDKFLSSADIPPPAVKFTDATNVLIAYKMINQMRAGVSRSLNDNRVVAVKTENGKSAADLSSEIDRYFSVFFMPIFTYYNKKEELVFANYIDEIKLKIAEIDSQIAGVDSIVETLSEGRRLNASAPRSYEGQKGPEMVQLGESGIKNIVDLAERATLSSYLKETLEAKRLLVFERSTQQKELDRLTKYAASDRVISDHFKGTSEAMLSEIREDYVQLLQKNRQKLESDQQLLYTPVGAPILNGMISRSTVLQFVGVFGLALAACIFLITAILFMEQNTLSAISHKRLPPKA